MSDHVEFSLLRRQRNRAAVVAGLLVVIALGVSLPFNLKHRRALQAANAELLGAQARLLELQAQIVNAQRQVTEAQKELATATH